MCITGDKSAQFSKAVGAKFECISDLLSCCNKGKLKIGDNMESAGWRLLLLIMSSEINVNESDRPVCEHARFPWSKNHTNLWYFAI